MASEVWALAQLVLILAVGCGGADAGFRGGAVEEPLGAGVQLRVSAAAGDGLLNLPLAIYGHRSALSVWAFGAGLGELAGGQGEDVRAGVGDWRAAGDADVLDDSQVADALVVLVLDSGGGCAWWPGVFVTPYVIDPLFNKFEPLAQTDPALVERLEQVVARGAVSRFRRSGCS